MPELIIKPVGETKRDCVAFGEGMFRFDPGFVRVRNTRNFKVAVTTLRKATTASFNDWSARLLRMVQSLPLAFPSMGSAIDDSHRSC